MNKYRLVDPHFHQSLIGLNVKRRKINIDLPVVDRVKCKKKENIYRLVAPIDDSNRNQNNADLPVDDRVKCKD